MSTSGEAAATADSVRHWSENADAIALSGVREARASGHETSRLEDQQRIKDATTRVPVRDDSLLAEVDHDGTIRGKAMVVVAIDPSAALDAMDVIATATSEAGHKVLGIMRVKPGCVITDVARPLDMSACLAETIGLVLKGRYENFTVGRNISWPKVKEIYGLGLKHGMKLATISGINGPTPPRTQRPSCCSMSTSRHSTIRSTISPAGRPR